MLVIELMRPQSHHSRSLCVSSSNAGKSSREKIRLETAAAKPGRVLVVDDEVHARAVLAELLREEGFFVETAADGLHALPKLVDFAPEVLVTDLEMPGMDGITLMRKAQQYDPSLPVVITTASGSIDSAVSAMREGATDYLTKPLNADEVTRSVKQSIERRRSQRNA